MTDSSGLQGLPTVSLSIDIHPIGMLKDGITHVSGQFALTVRDATRVYVNAQLHYAGDPAEIAGEAVKKVLRQMPDLTRPPGGLRP